ncbi:hypothetical protein [Aeribacillus pallidus]|uniref:hypothetical protein n=1 Tax=Aeribacillus pallidus TaxID=33936 RepID=UPI003D1BA3CE
MSRDKRITLAQCQREINKALDVWEEIAKETLHKEFGFGPKRQERFVERFSRVAHSKLLEQYARMRRMVK